MNVDVQKRLRVAHYRVRDLAFEFAREWYEQAAHENGFYARWPSREGFVQACWNSFSNDARAVLAQMLGGDYPESTKEKIYEALLQDGAFNPGYAAIEQEFGIAQRPKPKFLLN